MNSKSPKSAKFDRAVGIAQQLHKMVATTPSASAVKKNYETPTLSKMVKLGAAISKRITPAGAHQSGGANAGGYRPSKEQLMHFATQLKNLPHPGQGGGNILKGAVQYGKQVHSLSKSLMTAPAEHRRSIQDGQHANDKPEPSGNRKAALSSSSKPSNEKNSYETPTLSRMVKMGSAISRKMGIPDAQDSGGSKRGHTGADNHRPSREQLMDFAVQLKKLPRPDQGGNILKGAVHYGKQVQSLSTSLMTPPSTGDGTQHNEKNGANPKPDKSTTTDAHPFKAMGKEAARQRQDTIKQTMQGAEHQLHSVIDMLGEISQGKIEHPVLRKHFKAIGAQLPAKGGAGGFGGLSEITPKSWEKHVQGFAEMGSSNSAALIMAAHQAMSSKINEKLKNAQKPTSKLQKK